MGLVALSLGLSWYFARTGRDTGPHPHAPCLADGDCQAPERCVVVPATDGFASFGQCGEPCADDAACPNGWACGVGVEAQGVLRPERSQPAQQPRTKVCMHRSVQ